MKKYILLAFALLCSGCATTTTPKFHDAIYYKMSSPPPKAHQFIFRDLPGNVPLLP